MLGGRSEDAEPTISAAAARPEQVGTVLLNLMSPGIEAGRHVRSVVLTARTPTPTLTSPASRISMVLTICTYRHAGLPLDSPGRCKGRRSS